LADPAGNFNPAVTPALALVDVRPRARRAGSDVGRGQRQIERWGPGQRRPAAADLALRILAPRVARLPAVQPFMALATVRAGR